MLTVRFGVQVDMSDEGSLFDQLDQFGEPSDIIDSSSSQIVAITTLGYTATITGDIDVSSEAELLASTVTGIIIRDPSGGLMFSVTGIEDQTFNSLDSGSGDARLNDQIAEGVAVYGSPNHDVLFGDLGADLVRGGAGNDKVYASVGPDVLSGEAGNDALYGESGHDTMNGDAGHDTLRGGKGNDTLTGGTENDRLFGDAGNDSAWGDDGNDNVQGGSGNDLLRGGKGNDVLSGDSGNDRLYGDNGYDTVSGGAGNDVLYGGAHGDHLRGDDGNDQLHGGGGGLDFLDGGAGSDNLRGDDGHDTLDGGAGNDILTGGADEDYFRFGLAGGIDKVMDFAPGEDAIILSLAAFPELDFEGLLDVANFAANAGGRALQPDDYIVYDTAGSKAGALYYDPDGNGDDPAIRIGVIVGAPALTHEDFGIVF